MMISNYKFNNKLKSLQKSRQKLREAYAQDLKSAYKEYKSEEDIQEIRAMEMHEVSMIDEEISMLATTHWISVAEKKALPVPSRDDKNMWKQCHTMSREYVLTNNGITQIRSEYNKLRDSKYHLLFQTIAALTGIIGAITGLIAIMNK